MAPSFKYEQHPRGHAGSHKSVLKTVQAAAAGRLDPRVAAWAQSRIKNARVTDRGDRAGQARALLEAIRREKFWIPDPVDGERIAIPSCLLAECGGLTFEGGDCDDLSAALAALYESVGLTSAIVGQAFDLDGHYQHVLVAVEVADGDWYYADPSEPLAFGTANVPTKEIWRLVPSGRVLCERSPSCEISMRGAHPETGDRTMGDSVYVGDIGSFADDWKNAGADERPPSATFGGALAGVVSLALLGLAGYGGYRLIKEW